MNIIKIMLDFPRKIAIGMINFYQKQVSPKLGLNCRFYPTCSEYTKQAIDKYGIIRGSLKGIIRILKCNPFHKGGIDYLK